MTVHALYRFFDHEGELLYVGITLNPAARWKKHADEKPWWTEIGNISIEPHPDRRSVLDAERLAISTEYPMYNVIHNPQPETVVQMVDRQIVWTCAVCHEAIEDYDGYIVMDLREVSRYPAKEAEWETEHPDEDGPWNIADWLSYPLQPRWHPLHGSCDFDTEVEPYSIDVERIRTHAQLLEWTAHLFEKNWFARTNWHGIIRAVLDSSDDEAVAA